MRFMANEKKLSQRDETLVRILERLSDDIQKQGILLDVVGKQQLEQSANIERVGLAQHARLDLSDAATEKTHETFLRYRSDMLHIVNEQDRLNDIIRDLVKKQAAIAFSQENIANILSELSERLETHEKAVRDVNTYSIKHEEALTSLAARLEVQENTIREVNKYSIRHDERLSKEISDMSRSVTKLHMDTEKSIGDMTRAAEKRLGEVNRDTQRRFGELSRDTMRRLMALDKIESSLGVLLVRTEPPEKKPFFTVRLYRRFRGWREKRQLRRNKE